MSDKVVSLRPLPFKVPKPVESQFFQVDESKNIEFMISDLAKSGLEPNDISAYTTPLLRKDGATGAYGIPYYNLDGRPIVDRDGFPVMWRARFKMSEYSKESRYTQPNAEQLLKYDLPSHLPYINPLIFDLEGDTLVCCEGEKKTVSVLKHLRLPAFGIGGCQMWRDPDKSGSIHRWILKLAALRGIRKFLIIPDGDVMRYDICSAYGTFAHSLRAADFQVEIVDTGGKIDDLLVQWGASACENFGALQRIDPDTLVQSPDLLARKYNLAFRQDSKGGIVVHQHTANIMKLMEEHDAFPKFWRNTDTNRVMVGEVAAQPDLTEMEIANYFQHNLRFDKVTSRLVYQCIQALSKRNSKSPFLDYIRGLVWDGAPRLDNWISRLWGVENSDYLREVSAKWLVSACARLDKPGTKVDWMLIVIGPQGTGKTSMPGILFKGSNLTLYGEHNDKDLHMLLHSALCVGFDELDSFGKRESSNLKAMITRNEDAFRPPYGASVEIFPRRFTLYGCGNRYEFLQHDPSGYRRYAVVEVAQLLDFSGLEAERDQLWAEAWHRYQEGGVKYWEVEDASTVAQKYAIVNPMEDKVRDFLNRKRVDKVGGDKKQSLIVYFSMTEILTYMGHERESRNSSFIRELSELLRNAGCTKPEKSIRHPETGVVGKWYSYEHKE
jgi:predicted P-loop ATPase